MASSSWMKSAGRASSRWRTGRASRSGGVIGGQRRRLYFLDGAVTAPGVLTIIGGHRIALLVDSGAEVSTCPPTGPALSLLVDRPAAAVSVTSFVSSPVGNQGAGSFRVVLPGGETCPRGLQPLLGASASPHCAGPVSIGAYWEFEANPGCDLAREAVARIAALAAAGKRRKCSFSPLRSLRSCTSASSSRPTRTSGT